MCREFAAGTHREFHYVGRGKLADQFSDVTMYELREGVIFVQYILENEVQAKSKTVLRKIGYEGAIYRRQLGNGQIFPIVSLLLYWGTSPWTQPTSIKEFFQGSNLDKGTWKYIANEKLHVFAMAGLPKQIRNRFRSDMRIVVDYLAERYDYRPTAQIILHPEALLLMLRALTNDKRYMKVLRELTEEEKRRDITMCELLDKYENRGIQKGIQRGESRFAMLSEKLLQSNRIEDLRKAVSSKRYRNQLYKEFGMV